MSSYQVTDENRIIANTIREIFNTKPMIWSYADEKEESKIPIISCENSPFESVTSHGTIGLSDYSIGLDVDGIPLGIEMVGACASEFDLFPNILSTCAFNIINSHFKCYPGEIFRSVVEMYYKSFSMKHILFARPFGWEKEFTTLEFKTKKVAWLLIVPISDAEYLLAMKKGADFLETFFEQKQIDIYDLNRPSIA